MRYVSPIPVLDFAGVKIDSINKASLPKIQKRLLVELDLSGGQLQIEGRAISKDDILSLIDELQDEKILEFHKWIYLSKGLYAFLINQPLPDDRELFDHSLQYHYWFRDFKIFLSPYLAPPLAKALNQSYLKRQFLDAIRLLQFQSLLHDTDTDACFSKVRNSIRALAAEVNDLEKGTPFDPAKLSYIDVTFFKFLNELPDSMSTVREEIAVELINLSVRIQKKHTSYCYKLYLGLKTLKCSEVNHKLILDNLEVFSKNKEVVETRTSTGRGCLTIVGVIILISFLVKTCGRASRYNSGERSKVMNEVLANKIKQARFQYAVKKIQSKQLDPVANDSLQKTWLVKQPLNQFSNAWPHAVMFDSLGSYDLAILNSLTVSNQSAYDIALYVHTSLKHYSTFVPRGKSVRAKIGFNDRLSVCIGRKWNDKIWFDGPDVEELHGLFSETDSTALLYSERYWEVQCVGRSDCKNLQLTFTSPVPESLKLTAEPDVVKLKELKDLINPLQRD